MYETNFFFFTKQCKPLQLKTNRMKSPLTVVFGIVTNNAVILIHQNASAEVPNPKQLQFQARQKKKK